MGQITLNHLQAISLMEMLGESTTDGETTITRQGNGTLIVATPESTVSIDRDGNIVPDEEAG